MKRQKRGLYSSLEKRGGRGCLFFPSPSSSSCQLQWRCLFFWRCMKHCLWGRRKGFCPPFRPSNLLLSLSEWGIHQKNKRQILYFPWRMLSMFRNLAFLHIFLLFWKKNKELHWKEFGDFSSRKKGGCVRCVQPGWAIISLMETWERERGKVCTVEVVAARGEKQQCRKV